MAAERHDYAFPFRIDAGSRQAARTGYEKHVQQMIVQVLLTAPGERADLPEFGCGLRALVFAPHSDALAATTQLLVQQALGRWLSDHIAVRSVEVLPPSSLVDEEQLVIRIEYVLVATRAAQSVDVKVA
jgi:uncharacterized protein